jgi:hypothetical protein
MGSEVHLLSLAVIPRGLPCKPYSVICRPPCSLDVTTAGEQSAGAISVALQMIVNGGNTEGLFHGAFMQSGAVIPRGDISLGQQDYDDLVRETGCAGAEDTLECLRQLPFATLKKAMDMAQGILSYRVCHDFLRSVELGRELSIAVSEPYLGPEGGWDIP